MSRIALVSGKYRSEEGLAELKNILDHGFQENILDRVIFTTWASERESLLPFAKKFPNVTFIASPEPSLKIDILRNPIFQSIAWRYAIPHMSDQDVVLKLRTDKVTTRAGRGLLQVMARWDDLPPPNLDGGWPKIFERRIVAPSFNPSYAFQVHDITFMAQVSDFKKMASMDLAHLLLYRAPSAEGYFHSAAFLNEMPEGRKMLQCDTRLFSVRGNARRWHEKMTGNKSWMFFWLLCLQIVRRYYVIGLDPANIWVDSEQKERFKNAPPTGLLDFLFNASTEYGLRDVGKHDGMVGTSNWWLENLSNCFADHDTLAQEIWGDLNASFSAANAKWSASAEEVASIRSEFKSFVQSSGERRAARTLYPLGSVETW